MLLPKMFAQLCLLRVEVTHRLHFTAFIRFEKLTLPHSLTGVFFFNLLFVLHFHFQCG